MPSIKRLIPRGDLDARLERSLHHLSGIPRQRLTRDLAHPERAWAYGADMPGRWLELVGRAADLGIRAAQDMPATTIVDDLLRYQQVDGMLGHKYDSTAWACAGRGLAGLVEAYAAFRVQAGLRGGAASGGLLRAVLARTACPPRLHGIARSGALRRGERGRAGSDHRPGHTRSLSRAGARLSSGGHRRQSAPLYQCAPRAIASLWPYRRRRVAGASSAAAGVAGRALPLGERRRTGVAPWVRPGGRYDDANFSGEVRHLARQRDETCTSADWMLLEPGAGPGHRRGPLCRSGRAHILEPPPGRPGRSGRLVRPWRFVRSGR